ARFPFAEQAVETALLAGDVEARGARSVEQGDAREHRAERFLLAAYLSEQRFESLREVPEVGETECRGEIGQRAGMDGVGRECESDVRQRHLPSVPEEQHEVGSRTEGTEALFHPGDLAPADAQL